MAANYDRFKPGDKVKLRAEAKGFYPNFVHDAIYIIDRLYQISDRDAWYVVADSRGNSDAWWGDEFENAGGPW